MALDISKIITPVSKVASPASGSLSDAWQALVGDKIAAWRMRNAANLQVKIFEELKGMNLSLNISKIPDRYAFAWFEEATKQDEPEIQVLFVRLLAKAASGDSDASDRRHLEIITNFTPDDAVAMKIFYGHLEPRPAMIGINGIPLPPDVEMQDWLIHRELLGKTIDDPWRSIEHLSTLGIFEKRTNIDRHSLQRMFRSVSPNSRGEFEIGFGSEVELKTFIGSTVTGVSLARALGQIEP